MRFVSALTGLTLIAIVSVYLLLSGGEAGVESASKTEITQTPPSTAAQTSVSPPSETSATIDWKNFAKPSDATLRTILTPLQYNVTQHEGTEPAYNNEYWQTKEEGIYVDIVSGEPLFSSKDKYDSGTGWPSFTKPLPGVELVLKEDSLLGYVRTEVRSKFADSHLGHLFDDGPPPEGIRYCMNSASLRFIPMERLVEEGYGEYATLFE